MSSGNLVLGIDAGFRALGWALVDVKQKTIVEADAFRTKPEKKKRGIRVADDDVRCCKEMFLKLYGLVTRQDHMGVIVELPSGGSKGARANRGMGMATGIIGSLWATYYRIPFEWVTPTDVKLAATGKRAASKEGVARGVQAHLNDEAVHHLAPWKYEHIYDAAGAVLAAWDGVIVRTALRG